MIRLICTHCKATLEMDDAFLGGVCRCQHCGTIQTVPSHLKTTSDAAVEEHGAEARGNGATRSVGAIGTRGNGTGLYDLADVVASSGLSRSGLRQESGGPPGRGKDKPGPSKNLVLILAAAGGVIVLLLAVILWLALRGSSSASGTAPQGGQEATSGTGTSGSQTPSPSPSPAPRPTPGPAPTPAGPHFLSDPIAGSRVVYVVDCSDSSREIFDPLKAALFNSLASLGPQRQFAVILWGTPGETDWSPRIFPPAGLAPANAGEVSKCRDQFADTVATGATDVRGAMEKAVALHPDLIFLVTRKGYNLTDDVAPEVEKIAAGADVRIDTIDLSGGDGRSVLEAIAAKSGGRYFNISPDDLK